MSEPKTIRERIYRATSRFDCREGILLTTFNLNSQFLEQQALPIILGVDLENSEVIQRSDVHEELAKTLCSVYYDPCVAPQVSGNYRYEAIPVPVRNRYFHPKLVAIAGAREGLPCVYLAVSSANLTLSGWGRNVESFGETWLHTPRQQSWIVFSEFLKWLEECTNLGQEGNKENGIGRVKSVLEEMPNHKVSRTKGPHWNETLSAELYVSVVHKQGFPHFLQLERKRAPRQLWVCSPYWSSVEENVKSFRANETSLVPARSRNGSKLSLTQAQEQNLSKHKHVDVFRNENDNTDRFWHMKSYEILHNETCYTAVGSCNFTEAGLKGDSGNVEAMLVFEGWFDDLKLELEKAKPEDLADEEQNEEEVPNPAPIVVVVAFDWRARKYRWRLDEDDTSEQYDFKLHLPNSKPRTMKNGKGAFKGEPPERGASYEITYRCGTKEKKFVGHIVELNLDFSCRTYGRALSASEILDSWRGRKTPSDAKNGDGPSRGKNGKQTDEEQSATSDAVNLYDFYRAVHLQRKQLEESPEDSERRAMLVSRPDSFLALCYLAKDNGEATVVRFLVLKELFDVIEDWKAIVGRDLVSQVRKLVTAARRSTIKLLEYQQSIKEKQAKAMLQWFVTHLRQGDPKE